MAATTVARGAGAAHLLVVGLMLCENLLTHLLASLVDIGVELVAVLFNGKLLVVVNRNENLLRAIGLVIRVMELCHVRMLQGLLSSQPLAWIKLEEAL